MNTLAECEAPALAWARRKGGDRTLAWFAVLAARCAVWCREMRRGDPDAEDMLRLTRRAVGLRLEVLEQERHQPIDAYEEHVARLDEEVAYATRWKGRESYGLPPELVIPPMEFEP